jgi:hypothetical protein
MIQILRLVVDGNPLFVARIRGLRIIYYSDREGAQKNATNLNVTLEFLPNGDCKTVSPILRKNT